jgi:nitrite reductase (NADH) large subunit
VTDHPPAQTAADRAQAGRERLVLVGNGLAGMRVLEELLRIAPERYAITVFGAETHDPYNRIMLSPVLAGEKSREDIVTHDAAWFEQHGITQFLGDPVVFIDRQRRLVHSRQGRVVAYDRLILATGSRPAMPAIPGIDLPGVVPFRDFDDVARMLDACGPGKRAVVIGGGLLGIEAADGLVQRGTDVTLVHRSAVLLNQQLDAEAAQLLTRTLQGRGLKLCLSADTECLLGESRVSGVQLRDGRLLPADLVVIAIGVRPNHELAQRSELHCARGVVVNDALRTDDPAIYAVGECVEHRGATFGLVAPLWEQARVCAGQLAGEHDREYQRRATATKLKVSGIDLYSAGDFSEAPGRESLVLRDTARGVYKRLVLEHGRICGVVLYGDVADGHWYFELLQSGAPVEALRGKLIFGRAWCEPAAA